MVISNQLIRFSPRFQRAIHIRYDLRSPETIDRYIPTTSAVKALESILKGTETHATQRAHVLHAAYGSGKSLFAVCVASLLENHDTLIHHNDNLAKRLAEVDAVVSDVANTYLQSGKHLLPVVLSGNEGDFATALIRALSRALHDVGLADIQPTTRFDSVMKTLDEWRTTYPHALESFERLLGQEYNASLEALTDAIVNHNEEAFSVFEALYPKVTAGAVFDRFHNQAPELIYRDVATQISQLADRNYDGIVVIWDEFGRYLEGRTTDVFRGEAAILQNFAETCNYSGEQQIHLLLFAHKELQSYASSLPKSYQQEWSRIEGRFQRHNVISDPYVAYRLVSSSLEHTDEALIHELLPENEVRDLALTIHGHRLFEEFTAQEVEQLLYATFPLHPLTVHALVHLSNRVAQNERTLFTFLVADEPNALQRLIQTADFDFGDKFIRVDALWDYFEDAIRTDTGVNGAYRIWAGVANALEKIPANAENEALITQTIKTLGVLLICAEQTPIRPSTELLEWAVGRTGIEPFLKALSRRKAIINRKIDEYWTFTNGSDIDFEKKLNDVLERTNPTPLQLRRLLEHYMPAPLTYARRYNQANAIIRYFTGIYRWVNEIPDTPWDLLIRQQVEHPDGVVVYLLSHDDIQHEAIQHMIEYHPRVVYVYPEKPLLNLNEILRELFALQELENDPALKQHEDNNRIEREIKSLIEDAQLRLEREMAMLVEPQLGKSIWVRFSAQNPSLAECYQVMNASYPTSLLSKICEEVFGETPTLNSDGLNKHQPTTQQIKASEKLINALFTSELSKTLGFEGYGPEVLNLNTLLIATHILREENEKWVIGHPPNDAKLAQIWHIIDDYLIQTRKQKAVSIEALVQTLTEPPYGIRLGVIPVLFSAVVYRHLRVLTIRKDGRVQIPITGELITEVFAQPTNFTVEIGEWNDMLERLWQAILSRFGSNMSYTEHQQQPLALYPILMLRWFQSLGQFCRITGKLEADALRFRDVIRKAQTEPAKIFFEELPNVLAIDAHSTQAQIEERLDSLMSAISNTYLDLQRRLDLFVQKEFGQRDRNGFSALQTWAGRLQAGRDVSLKDFRFGNTKAQQFVNIVISQLEEDALFWDKLGKAIIGNHLRDWTDQSEIRFYDDVSKVHIAVEQEVQELVAEESVVAISLQMPDNTEHEFRFRSADLTAQGKRLLQNFMSTLEIAGRPLSADEKRQIAIAFLLHVMGENVIGNR
ncbi:MAG: hypothetical protein SFZ02_21290 [bacterium]|nr:hypothetical protein [bacterium]